MTTYISILRGINVSGQKLLKMEALKKLYEALGLQQVSTYIQSGNVVFQAATNDAETLAQQIAQKIREDFSYTVPVLVKEIGEWKAIVQNNPYLKDKDAAFLHVTLLSALPAQEKIDALKEATYKDDTFAPVGNVLYLYCPYGYGNTKLTNNFFESKLKVTATTRNWKTMETLLKMAESYL